MGLACWLLNDRFWSPMWRCSADRVFSFKNQASVNLSGGWQNLSGVPTQVEAALKGNKMSGENADAGAKNRLKTCTGRTMYRWNGQVVPNQPYSELCSTSKPNALFRGSPSVVDPAWRTSHVSSSSRFNSWRVRSSTASGFLSQEASSCKYRTFSR